MRKTEIGVTDSFEYKNCARDTAVRVYINLFRDNGDVNNVFTRASKIHHSQLEIISTQVSSHSQTMDKDMFEEFCMRIKDNMNTLNKFDKELDDMVNSRAYNLAEICAYPAVLQAELRGMLDSLESLNLKT